MVKKIIAMNIALDIGNTYAKLAFFENKKLIHFQEKLSWEMVKSTLEKQIFDKIIVSDVKNIAQDLLTIIPANKIIFFNAQTSLPIQNLYESPQTLGTDRLAAAVGAYFCDQTKAHLLIGLGTAMTIDFINEKGQYLGGNISLGLNMRFRALHEFTKKLPLIQRSEQMPDLLGKTTEQAIKSGVMWGMVAEIQGFVQNYSDKFGNLEVHLFG
ncbi:MAG: type III pantothenate kinase, partial [Bacteroidetes bacterium]